MTSTRRSDVFEVSANGARLHAVRVFASTVDARSRVLFVLHGGPGEAHDCLRPFLDTLASERRSVVFADQRGGGRSVLDDSARAVGWRDLVSDIDTIRLALGNDRIDVLGFSWGAVLALLYATEFASHVDRLVLVSPGPIRVGLANGSPAPTQSPNERPEVRAFLATLGESRGTVSDRFVRRIAPFLADPRQAHAINPVECNDAVAASIMASLGAYDLRPGLARLKGTPAFVIRGDLDPMPATAAKETADALDCDMVSIADAGHAPFAENPRAFVSVVESFLDAGCESRA